MNQKDELRLAYPILTIKFALLMEVINIYISVTRRKSQLVNLLGTCAANLNWECNKQYLFKLFQLIKFLITFTSNQI